MRPWFYRSFSGVDPDGRNVRVGSKADIPPSTGPRPLHPESGHRRAGIGMSALCQKRTYTMTFKSLAITAFEAAPSFRGVWRTRITKAQARSICGPSRSNVPVARAPLKLLWDGVSGYLV